MKRLKELKELKGLKELNKEQGVNGSIVLIINFENKTINNEKGNSDSDSIIDSADKL